MALSFLTTSSLSDELQTVAGILRSGCRALCKTKTNSPAVAISSLSATRSVTAIAPDSYGFMATSTPCFLKKPWVSARWISAALISRETPIRKASAKTLLADEIRNNSTTAAITRPHVMALFFAPSSLILIAPPSFSELSRLPPALPCVQRFQINHVEIVRHLLLRGEVFPDYPGCLCFHEWEEGLIETDLRVLFARAEHRPSPEFRIDYPRGLLGGFLSAGLVSGEGTPVVTAR